MTLSANLQGDAQLRAALEVAVHQLRDLDVDDALAQLAAGVQGSAPVDTGFLAKSVTVVDDQVTVAAPYALYVHAANPWAARELDRQSARILETIEGAIVDTVAQIGD